MSGFSGPFVTRRSGGRSSAALRAAVLAVAIVYALLAGAAVAAGATLVDAGFESRADGALLASPPWTASGAPQHREYDDARAKTGSMSAWIQGAAAGTNAGAFETASGGLGANGAELTFWLYLDSATGSRLIEDYAGGVATADRAFQLQFAPGGAINVFTDRSGATGYAAGAFTRVGTYTTGWAQYRIVYTFSGTGAQTYTLSTRTNAAASWTELKSAGATSYDIPFRGTNTITATHGTLWRGLGNAQLWIDDLTSAEGAVADTTPPAAPSGLVALGGAGEVALSWTPNAEPDVAGYNLYRDGVKVNAELITGTSFTDVGRADVTSYSYRLCSVDTAGNVSPLCDAVSATTGGVAPPTGTLVDAGFESGADGASLATPPWTASGVPQHREYDNARAKTGAMSAWIQGSAAGTNAGMWESSSARMSANGAEITFWLYLDNTTDSRLIEDYAAGVSTTDRAFQIQFAPGGVINVFTDRSGAAGYSAGGFTQVGIYAAGWTQYRISYTFTGSGAQSYTLSQRLSTGDAWTRLKASGAADYAIPFRGTNTITATHGTLWRGLGNAELWLDDLTYTEAAIGDITPPAVPAGLAAVPGDGEVALSWTANSEPDLAGYDVYRDGVKVNAALITGTSFTDTGRTNGTSYGYRLRAVNANGNASAQCPVVSATPVTPVSEGSVVDFGFESGADGGLLASPPWTASGAPQHREYDTARWKVGATSAWIQGASSGGNAGVWEAITSGLHSNGAEIRFWLYLDNTTDSRLVEDYAAGVSAADRAFQLQFGPGGAINVFTDRSGAAGYSAGAFTQVGTYAAGWTQYRIVYTFSGTGAQSYTLSKRAAVADAWTRLKSAGASDYAIPFRGANTISATHGTLWRALGNGQLWLDELRYADAAMSDGAASYTITASAGAHGSISPAGAVSVASGSSSPAFVIAADHGYAIADVLVDGVSVGTPSTYTFTGVSSAHTISATFAPVPGDMALVTDCAQCHTMPHGDFFIPCEECHDFGVKHAPGTASGVHTAADVTNCSPCHNSSLTLEHNGRLTKAGVAITCLTCHNSTDPAVTTAILTGNSACSACHAGAGHAGSHAFTSGSDVTADGDAGCTNSGSGCHGTDASHADVTTYHPATGCTGGACHTSPSKAGYSGDHDCQTCHDGTFTGAPARATLATQHYSATVHTATGLAGSVSAGGSASATCSDCHNPSPASGPAGLAGQHSGVGSVAGSSYGTTVACAECHNDTRANGNAVMRAGWASATCAACHTPSSSAPMHGSTAPAFSATSPDGCASTGDAGCHTTLDVHSLHKNADGGCSLTGCHDYAAQGAKPGITSCGAGSTNGCHPEKTLSNHGYDPAKHVSAETCLSTCHTNELMPAHSAQVTTTTLVCSNCHATKVDTIKPWDGTCGACHPTAVAAHAPELHVGTDVAYQQESFLGNGCGDSANHTDQTNCHDISSLSVLHSKMPGRGCTVCHAAPNTPKKECLDCHQVGSAVTYSKPGAITSYIATDYPTTDDFITAGWTYTTTPVGQARYAVVNTPYPPATTTRCLTITSNTAGGVLFGFDRPNLPSNARITDVRVYAKGKATNTTYPRKMQGWLKIGGQTYLSSNQSANLTTVWTAGAGTGFSTSSTRIDYTREPLYGETIWRNPKTGADWTAAQLNGTDPTNGLDAIGVYLTGSSAANNISLSQIYLKISYYVMTDPLPWPTVGTSTYHHDNVKYLHNPAEAQGKRFGVSPPSGWYDALYSQDCYDFCHRGNGGVPDFSAVQGTWMWYSVGGDPYDAMTTTRTLALKPITMPASATLSFTTQYRLGTGAIGTVEASTDGTTWTPLTGTVGGASMASLTGTSAGWVSASYDLSAYAGRSTRLRFRYINGQSTSAGWAFDSLSITGASGTVFSDDAETLLPDWTNTWWTRSKGAFPMR